MTLNCHNFSGHVGKDAEVRKTQTGTSVTSFRVASERGWGDRKKTTWVECSWFGDQGAKVAQYIRKGMKLTVTGATGLEEFDRRDGTKGTKMVCDVQAVDLPAREGGQQSTYQQSVTKPQSNPNPGSGDIEDEIPW